MAHRYTYPVVDRALQNFLILMLMFVVVIGGAVVFGADGEATALPMLLDQELDLSGDYMQVILNTNDLEAGGEYELALGAGYAERGIGS
ncbi:hypothetical protein [Halalkalicoccus salilacus]|uniref:hypothetical protein n=1 Tax=Halalkalicoccus salilacus TaxID=3117459 RepID=UPI00300E8645